MNVRNSIIRSDITEEFTMNDGKEHNVIKAVNTGTYALGWRVHKTGPIMKRMKMRREEGVFLQFIRTYSNTFIVHSNATSKFACGDDRTHRTGGAIRDAESSRDDNFDILLM